MVAGTTGEGAALGSVSWTAWAQTATVMAGTKVEGASLAYVPSVGIGSPSNCGCLHEAVTKGEGARLASFRSIGVGSKWHCGGGHDR